MSVFVLASTAGEKTLWDPTILGVLVVLSAVGLFCGSVYLLLATNLGARLGFLVAGACLSGFMVLLSSLWITTATPLNSPKGRPAEWEVKEVVDDPSASEIEAVRTIFEKGEPQDVEQLAQLRSPVDAALVRVEPEGGAEPPEQPFAQFGSSNDFLTEFDGYRTYVVGGGSKNVFWHEPEYAVVEICPRLEVEVAPGETPPPPQCDPLGGTEFVVLQHDLGSLRQPPWIYFGASLLTFILFLRGLHWYEMDRRERAAAGQLRPVPSS
ncbi:MAG: hypothetical protein KatS3mg010_1944 [Acidimicrobiia bacterium]|nr:MAG: hypothetical protein KatS3mg010_1944 [Acidimicrobiia bacterium]